MTASSTLPSRPGTAPAARPGPLGRLADLTFRHRIVTVLAWVAALGIAIVLAGAFGGDFKADYSAPGSDSSQAQQLLEDEFPAQSGDTVDVVVRTDGPVTAPAVRTQVADLLAKVATVPHVLGVDDPYTAPGSISSDGRTLVAHARLDVVNPPDMPVEDSQRLIDLADQATGPEITVALGGQSIAQAEQGAIGSEAIGITAAALILLVMFGSVVAAGLPIIVAVAGLAVSATLTTLLISFIDAPDWSTSLATMMGIGIGIDYALLMVTRFREWRAVGLDERAATVATLDTAGRAVMVAGSTVVVSMLGLFAMGLSFMRGAALVTILAVVVVLLASMTLFPALLGFLGHHIDRLRIPFLPKPVGRGRRRRPHRADPRLAGVEPAGRAAPSGGRDHRRGTAAAARVAVPRRPVRLPGRRQQPRDDHHPAGLRHAERGLRRGQQRAAADGRGAPGERREGCPPAGVRRARLDQRSRCGHAVHPEPGWRDGGVHRGAHHRPAGPGDRGPGAHPARHRAAVGHRRHRAGPFTSAG